MMRRIIKKIGIVALLAGLCACGQKESKAVVANKTESQKDESITKSNAFSNLFLDSAALERFILTHRIGEKRADQLRGFYESRNYGFAWFGEDGLEQQAQSFWQLHNRFVNYSQDSSFHNKQLHKKMRALLDDEEDISRSDSELAELELQLTEHFFDYAHYAYEGKIDPAEIKWHIPRKKINAIALLDSFVKHNGKQLDDWEPLNQNYKKLRTALMHLYQVQKAGGWPAIEGEKEVYRIGDSAAAIQRLKSRLYAAGDLETNDQTPIFNDVLEEAVMQAQRRFGLNADGIAGPRTIRELNVPVEKRIEQLLVNMERMRWMPTAPEGTLLMANIPEFRLYVYEGRQKAFDMKIVVGKAANKTVVFSDELKHVVFSPYWNIPRSIVRNEILPAMRRNPGYLSQNNMEQTGTSGGLPVIRQKPGPGNALGKVKFLFPNSYNIYFHDTPAKSLFGETRRAFSHGCIRLEEPKKLVKYLLQDRPEWTENRITKAMNAGSEKWVALEEPVAVAITYFTAWVNEDGLLNFRDDIYGHDEALASKLFE